MKTATSDLRLVVIRAYKAGLPRKQIGEIVGYHMNTINRWIKEYESSNRIEPLAKGHRRPMFNDEELKRLEVLLEEKPNITLQEIRETFDKDCALSSIYNHIRRLGFGMRRGSASAVRKSDSFEGGRCANGYYRLRSSGGSSSSSQ